MRLDHEFSVPVSAAQAWPVLLDIDRIAPCMPGATITKVDGDEFEGTVKVKVGPITVTYGGTASFLEKDESQRIAVLEARGKETRGSGTATARVTAQLFDEGATSRVAVTTDLSITGKPAQFGRGVMVDVGNKLLGRFADCLAKELGSDSPATPPAAPADSQPAAANGSTPVTTPADTTADAPAAADSASASTAAAAAAGAAAGSGTTGAVAGTAPADTGSAGTGTAGSASAADPDGAVEVTEPAAVAPAPASVLDAPRREAEPIDLLDAAGGAVAKRVIPVLGAAALLAILVAVLRRRR
jgi:carbon monoxide dehydrogenase subunit G